MRSAVPYTILGEPPPYLLTQNRVFVRRMADVVTLSGIVLPRSCTCGTEETSALEKAAYAAILAKHGRDGAAMLKTRADPVSRISGRAGTYKAHRLSGELEVAMDHRDILERIISSSAFIADREICSTRRGLLLAPLLAALPRGLGAAASNPEVSRPASEHHVRPRHWPLRIGSIA